MSAFAKASANRRGFSEAGQADLVSPATAFAPNRRYRESRRSLRRRRKVDTTIEIRDSQLLDYPITRFESPMGYVLPSAFPAGVAQLVRARVS